MQRHLGAGCRPWSLEFSLVFRFSGAPRLAPERTKIPDPPIHFSGPTNFFGPKIDFTNHQFETSVLDPPMSSGPLSNHQTVVNPRGSRLNFCEEPIAVFRICKRCGERESRRGEQQEQCQPREHLFIGGKGSTRLCCAYFPITRWPSGDCFARRSLFLRRKQASARGRATLHHETITHKRT